MVVVMQVGAKEPQIQKVIDRLVAMGFDVHRSTGVSQTVLGAVGAKPAIDTRDLEVLDGVAEVIRISTPFKLASRTFRPEDSVIRAGPKGHQVAILCNTGSKTTLVYRAEWSHLTRCDKSS